MGQKRGIINRNIIPKFARPNNWQGNFLAHIPKLLPRPHNNPPALFPTRTHLGRLQLRQGSLLIMVINIEDASP